MAQSARSLGELERQASVVGPPLIVLSHHIVKFPTQLDYHYSLPSHPSKVIKMFMPMTHRKRTFFADIFFSRVLSRSGPSARITRIAIILYPSSIVLVPRSFQRKIYCLFRSCDSGWRLTPDLGVPGLTDPHIRSRYASRYQWTSPFSLSGVSTLRNIFS